jgi:hypothetical protein
MTDQPIEQSAMIQHRYCCVFPHYQLPWLDYLGVLHNYLERAKFYAHPFCIKNR